MSEQEQQEQPGQQQSKPPEPEIDLTPYERFLVHDKWQNRIKVQETQLIKVFYQAARYMEELHRKQLQQVNERVEDSVAYSVLNKPYLARTVHHQLAAIIKRYLPKIEKENPALAAELQPAIAEANLIEKLAAKLAEDVSNSRERGNVRFVDNLTPRKVAGTT